MKHPKIFLLEMCTSGPGIYQGHTSAEPISIEYLGAYLKQEIPEAELRFSSDRFEDPPNLVERIASFNPDYVGISSMTFL